MSDGPNGAGPLVRVARVAREVGTEAIADEAEALASRLGEGRFFVACLGQFKRGKSTLINALLGQDLLPTGVVPVTAIVTVVRWGESASARVKLCHGGWRAIALDAIAEYVAEERNPENEKGVTGIEVFAPSARLRNGMCLVDTPGIGSVFAGNTEATRDFVPHVDAALVVLGADPPISGVELDLVENATKLVTRFIVVMNKADRLTDEERVQGRDFAARVLEKRLRREVGPIFEVSAVERCRGGPTRDWCALEAALAQLSSERIDVVRSAEVRGARRLSERLERELDEQIGALLRPREESERRIEGLRRSVSDSERTLDEMGYLFTAVQDRLTRSFQATREAFLARARQETMGDLARVLDSRPDVGPRDAMELAQSIARTHIESWRAEVAPEAERMYREAVVRFVELANEFLQRVASAGDLALATLPGTFEPDTGFRTKPEFYFNELLTLADPKASTRLAALVGSRERIVRDAAEYLDRLFETNSARVANDFVGQVLESRRRLQQDVRETLRSVVVTAERALVRAEAEQVRGATSVGAAVARLRRARSELGEAS